MNVYITTYHRVKNYGAALQSFALQQYLSKLGFPSKLILCKDKKNKRPLTARTFLFLVLKLLFKLIHKKEIKSYNDRYDLFFKENHQTTMEYEDYAQLCMNYPKDGVYISGSDQVFNPNNINPMFFLQFVDKNIKKINFRKIKILRF